MHRGRASFCMCLCLHFHFFCFLLCVLTLPFLFSLWCEVQDAGSVEVQTCWEEAGSTSSGSLERPPSRPCQFVPPPPPDSPPPPVTPGTQERARSFQYSRGVEVADSSIQVHVSSPLSGKHASLYAGPRSLTTTLVADMGSVFEHISSPLPLQKLFINIIWIFLIYEQRNIEFNVLCFGVKLIFFSPKYTVRV